VFALAGTSIAAVNFARNAGAVDGKSATGSGSSSSRAAGKLVATANSGSLKGKIPIRFLEQGAYVSGSKQTFAQGMAVTDNAAGAPVGLTLSPLGGLTATCADQNKTAAKEDPQVTITFTNTSGQNVNFSRSIGEAAPTVAVVLAATTSAFTINNSNSFHLYAQSGTVNYVMDGVVRQDNPGTADAQCVVYGYAVIL
jgi:hypothetical protein